jgi:RNA-directed DNA polymerase
MVRRVAIALGLARAPRWVGALVGEVLDAYRDAPADRPRELARFVRTTDGWRRGTAEGAQPPRVVRWRPVGTTIVRHRTQGDALPDWAAVARLLDVDQGELAWFADVRGLERTSTEALQHYRWRSVDHRGGVRLLAAPKPRLKEIQRRLLRHVLSAIPVHESAHGCVLGRSVRTAVAPHAGAAVVLRMDLEAFFASIPAGRIYGLLQGTVGLTEPVAHLITGLVTTVVPAATWRRVPVPHGIEARERHRRLGQRLAVAHLPQGAPTSPALANLVCFRLDRRLTGLAAAFGATYTRYVDDLVFSGGRSLGRGRLTEQVTAVVGDEGFRVNPGKTHTMSASRRQYVLGTVVNDRPTLPRPERDALRALLHNCATLGWTTQTRGHDPATFRDHVLGRIAWASSIDPASGARLHALAQEIDWRRP